MRLWISRHLFDPQRSTDPPVRVCGGGWRFV
jgi:hypothetical protein